MKIQILHCIEGAKKAEGLTVIIDVFRAFSLECYAFAEGADKIYPVGDIEEAYRRKKEDHKALLAGERNGKMCQGFDLGNSPSQLAHLSVQGKTLIHTTSAGTQGIANAVCSSEIVTGSLVNAKAVAEYIRRKNPDTVSLVCMGFGGVREAKEDTLCAEYIKSILTNQDFPIDERIKALRTDGGEHFFNRETQDVYPEADYWMCIEYDKFTFVLKIGKDNQGRHISERIFIDL